MWSVYSIHNEIVFPFHEFDTKIECLEWFRNECNIPANWKVKTPDGNWLIGKDYQSW